MSCVQSRFLARSLGTPLAWAWLTLGCMVGCAPGDEAQTSRVVSALSAGQSPHAQWVAGAKHYGAGRSQPVRRIVIHIAQANFNGALAAFTSDSPPVKASAHYFVHAGGRISQFVREEDTAWHVAQGNDDTIGIEHEGWAEQPGTYGEALFRSSALLVADIIHRRGLAGDPRSIVVPHRLHENVGGAKASCPGPFFQTGLGRSYFDLVQTELDKLEGRGRSSGSTTSSGSGNVGGGGGSADVEEASEVARRLFAGRAALGEASKSSTLVDPAFYEIDTSVDVSSYADGNSDSPEDNCDGAGAACLLTGSGSATCDWGVWRCGGSSGRCSETARCRDASVAERSRDMSCGPAVEGRACRLMGGELGVCAVGQLACVAGRPVCRGTYAGPQPEVCNGLDDDCSGVADDIPGSACSGEASARPAEACNGLDDDGDGYVDEGTDGGPCENDGIVGRMLCVAGTSRCAAADVPGLNDESTNNSGGGPWGCRMALSSHARAPWLLFAAFVCLSLSRRRRR